VKPSPDCASFDVAWRPDSYLAEYYRTVEEDERATMRFLAEAARRVGPVSHMLDFGCGPTVHHLFAFAPTAREIHVADYLASNLRCVRAWVDDRPGAHRWTAFADYALQMENGEVPSASETATREQLTRERITRYLRADAREAEPLDGEASTATYPLVLCCFCPDSITDDLREWRRCVLHIASLVSAGGWLVLAALHAACNYRVGAQRFPSARVTRRDIAAALADAGMARGESTITVANVGDERDHGFNGVILAISRRLSS
jgi:hypothetical protein